ncbi:hypothetical protein EVAR_89039_1 [Eumeta japonica]|uniref:Uncharacterized protein n=1 Tax=Eumeta variegata TaxID=151549 RepID=A0A4C1YZN1_EUMVA|nr:hypothetical protein EVAR_89039_1 [Eumeta japonica]
MDSRSKVVEQSSRSFIDVGRLRAGRWAAKIAARSGRPAARTWPASSNVIQLAPADGQPPRFTLASLHSCGSCRIVRPARAFVSFYGALSRSKFKSKPVALRRARIGHARPLTDRRRGQCFRPRHFSAASSKSGPCHAV